MQIMFHGDDSIANTQTGETLGETIYETRPLSVDIQLALYNVLIPSIAVLIIILNGIIVVTSGLILRKGQQPRPRSTYIFLGNVALSDLVLGINTVFGQFFPVELRNEMVCCVLVGLIVASTLASVYSIMLIGIDRYLYILYGLQYQRYLSTNRARLMVLLTWILGFVVGFLPAMGLRKSTNNGQLCWFIILVPPELVFITTTIGIIPLIVIVTLYSIILKNALDKVAELKEAAINSNGARTGEMRVFRGGQISRTSSVQILNGQSEPDIPAQNRRRRSIFRFKSKQKYQVQIAPVYNPSKWKAIKVVLLTTGCYFITWVPYFFASCLFVVCNPEKTPNYCYGLRLAIASPLSILGLCNSILNPIIYAWWHNGFRESMRKIYRGIFSKISRKDSIERADHQTSGNSSGNSNMNTGTGAVTSGSEYELSDVEQRSIISKKIRESSKKRSRRIDGIINSGNDINAN